jgi:hypothetical protein
MKLIKFPDNSFINVEPGSKFEVSGSDVSVTYPAGGTVSYTAGNPEQAALFLAQIVDNLIQGAAGLLELKLITVTTQTPDPGHLAAGHSLILTGTNFDLIADLHVYIDDGGGVTFYEYTVVSRTATSIVLTTVLNGAAGAAPYDLKLTDGTVGVFYGIDIIDLA